MDPQRRYFEEYLFMRQKEIWPKGGLDTDVRLAWKIVIDCDLPIRFWI